MTGEEEQLVDEFNECLFFDESAEPNAHNQGKPSSREDHFAFDDGPDDCG